MHLDLIIKKIFITMSKLPKEHRFLDFSDYGRPLARMIANSLKNTSFTPIHVTIGFIISGLIGVFFIVKGYYWYAAFFLILKSVLDAADGELARIKQQPSYTGRYFDSISDIILNALILISIWQVVNTNVWILVAFRLWDYNCKEHFTIIIIQF